MEIQTKMEHQMKTSRQDKIQNLKSDLEQVIAFIEEHDLEGESASFPLKVDNLPYKPIYFLQSLGVVEVFHRAEVRTDNAEAHTSATSDYGLFKHYMLIREDV